MLGTVLADTPQESIARPAGGRRRLFPGPGRADAGGRARQDAAAGCRSRPASTQLAAGRITLARWPRCWARCPPCWCRSGSARHAERTRAGHAAGAHPARRSGRGAAQSAHLVRMPAAVRLVRRSRGAGHLPDAAAAAGLARARSADGRGGQPRARAVHRGHGRGPGHRAGGGRAARPRRSAAHRRRRDGAGGHRLSGLRPSR